MAWRWFDDDYPPPSRPRAVKGGSRAVQTRHFGESWWASAGLAVLEGFNIGAGLGAELLRPRGVGLDYDRQGRVKAGVQGSQPRPYQVTCAANPGLR